MKLLTCIQSTFERNNLAVCNNDKNKLNSVKMLVVLVGHYSGIINSRWQLLERQIINSRWRLLNYGGHYKFKMAAFGAANYKFKMASFEL